MFAGFDHPPILDVAQQFVEGIRLYRLRIGGCRPLFLFLRQCQGCGDKQTAQSENSVKFDHEGYASGPVMGRVNISTESCLRAMRMPFLTGVVYSSPSGSHALVP